MKEITVLPVPEKEKNDIIYSILDNEFQLQFIFANENGLLQALTNPHLSIFAKCSLGYIGTLGGINDITESDYPVVLLTPNFEVIKIAYTIRKFMELVLFYPFWISNIEFLRKSPFLDVALEKEKWKKNHKEYLLNLSIISKSLNIDKPSNVFNEFVDCINESIKFEYIILNNEIPNQVYTKE